MMSLTAAEKAYKKEIREKTGMPLLWLAMASMVMLFAALTSAVIVSKSSREWTEIELPGTFLISTTVILFSSATYWWTYLAAKQDQMVKARRGVLITLILGFLFGALQFISWGILTDMGIFFAGATSTISGSFIYALSGLHLAHLAGGLISLIIVYVKMGRNHYNSKNLLGLQMSSTYWHFLDGLWVYLYIFLNFIAH